ncbi:flagellar protein FlaG [Lysinibacillus boronitolerans]|uniref:flagellar protein FlaG n=1 Tax=Lysinibacillus boronitolerans TaxID=309788 RepID=UPI0002F378F2|nr:flagellar protein FlaG [Lysinibacillus boronitolerans]
MHIVPQGQSLDVVNTSSTAISKKAVAKESVMTSETAQPVDEQITLVAGEQEISKEKLQQAVDAVNEFFQINQNALKFVFHEGLERYFVQVVDAKTEEVVKELPPKKLLDAFYEMQKLVGMIVDKKV